MIENGFTYAVEQAVKQDNKKERRAKSERKRLQELLISNHEEQIMRDGLANVDCSDWNKIDQKRILKLMKIEGYDERVIKRLWNLTKI